MLVCFLKSGDESFVGRRIVIRRINMGRHGADHGIAHTVEQIVIDHVTGSDDFDAGFVEPALDELFDEGGALPGRNKDENGVGLLVGRALQKRRKIRIGKRKADVLSTCPPFLVNSPVNDFSASAPGA